tara:strand:- start:671 stop:2968 length:2298 start_codon:yes stop_codon:yes gene_type:complete
MKLKYIRSKQKAGAAILDQTIQTKLKNILELKLSQYPFYFNINDIDKILKKNNAIISGSYILSLFHTEIERQYDSGYVFFKSDWEPSDIDIYVDLENAHNFYIDFVSYLIKNYEDYFTDTVHRSHERPQFRFVENNIAPQYDQSFFRKNGILGRTRIKIGRGSIDIMIVDNARQSINVVQNFDLSFCQTWYNGETINATNFDHITNKSGQLNDEYKDAYLSGNKFISRRIAKYRKRGFKIYLPPGQDYSLLNPIQNLQKTIVNYEYWLVTKLLLTLNSQIDNDPSIIKSHSHEYPEKRLIQERDRKIYSAIYSTFIFLLQQMNNEYTIENLKNLLHLLYYDNKYINNFIKTYVYDNNDMLDTDIKKEDRYYLIIKLLLFIDEDKFIPHRNENFRLRSIKIEHDFQMSLNRKIFWVKQETKDRIIELLPELDLTLTNSNLNPEEASERDNIYSDNIINIILNNNTYYKDDTRINNSYLLYIKNDVLLSKMITKNNEQIFKPIFSIPLGAYIHPLHTLDIYTENITSFEIDNSFDFYMYSDIPSSEHISESPLENFIFINIRQEKSICYSLDILRRAIVDENKIFYECDGPIISHGGDKSQRVKDINKSFVLITISVNPDLDVLIPMHIIQTLFKEIEREKHYFIIKPSQKYIELFDLFYDHLNKTERKRLNYYDDDFDFDQRMYSIALGVWARGPQQGAFPDTLMEQRIELGLQDEFLTHTVSFGIQYGYHPDLVSGNHCQAGSKLPVYTIETYEPELMIDSEITE